MQWSRLGQPCTCLSLPPFLSLLQRPTFETPPPELAWHTVSQGPGWNSEVAPRPRLFSSTVALQRLWYFFFPKIGRRLMGNARNIRLKTFLSLFGECLWVIWYYLKYRIGNCRVSVLASSLACQTLSRLIWNKMNSFIAYHNIIQVLWQLLARGWPAYYKLDAHKENFIDVIWHWCHVPHAQNSWLVTDVSVRTNTIK